MKISLRNKTLLMILLFAIALSGITVYVSGRVVTEIIKSNYYEKVADLSRTVALSLDSQAATVLKDEVSAKYQEHASTLTSTKDGYEGLDGYMDHFSALDAAAEYVLLERQLQAYQSLNGVESVYLCCIDQPTKTTVCMVDARKDSPMATGFPEKLTRSSLQVLRDPTEGIPAHIVSTTRGELVTAGAPVYDSRNDICCFVMVDLSTKAMHTQQFELVALLLTLIFGLTVLISFAAVFLMNRGVITPINQLSEAARQYCQEDNQLYHEHFAKLDIRTNDEVESLANSMKQMEQDINDSIAHLLSTTKELTSTRKEKEQLSTIAKKDALTGVRNKYSYNEEMLYLQQSLDAGDTEFGIVILDLNNLKHLNDTYGHDKGDIAIVNLCNITCEVFCHSPVFRIGGDEFAVILKNTDYDNIRQLVTTFYNTVSSHSFNADLDPWDRITAALGYALYDPKQDNDIQDTFHRADAAMYAQKKTMKSRKD